MTLSNRTEKNFYQKRYIAKLRRMALAILGRKCKRCGFSDERALQIDHPAGRKVQEDDAEHGSYYVYKNVLARPLDYQLLCANCNWIKRYENNEHRGGKRPKRSLNPFEAEEYRAITGEYPD